MKSTYNIHGFYVEVASDHPVPFEMIDQDLQTFRIQNGYRSKNAVKFKISILPEKPNGTAYPADFSEYQYLSSQFWKTPNGIVSRYGRSLITVINNPKKREIKAALVLEPSLFPDPAYHYCFTQPLSPWFKQKGLFFLHAGCISDEKRNGILLVGHSRAGKSTLSLAAVRAGFKFLSDEQPILSAAGGRLIVYSFPRQIRLDRPVAGLFSELKPILKSTADERIVFRIEQIWPRSITVSCKPKVLIFPKFHRRGSLKISPLPPSEALSRILQDDHFIWYLNGPWKKVSEEHLSLVSKLVQKTKAFELDYGKKDIFNTPTLFRRFLRTIP